MKVLNLRCGHRHAFEGWFASEQDFQDQLSRGLVACPLCADTAIEKMLTAPRLNLSGAASSMPSADSGSASRAVVPAVPNSGPGHRPSAGHDAEVQAAFVHGIRQLLKNTDDVGAEFAEEARRMHYGETPTRSIRGHATAQDALALVEEGIDVLPIPMLDALKHTLQ